MKTREFTQSDWWGFAGCVEWPGGKPPLISAGALEDGKEYAVVFDPTGACLVVEDHPASMTGGWILDLPFPTQEAARAFAAGIPDPVRVEDLLSLGFREA